MVHTLLLALAAALLPVLSLSAQGLFEPPTATGPFPALPLTTPEGWGSRGGVTLVRNTPACGFPAGPGSTQWAVLASAATGPASASVASGLRTAAGTWTHAAGTVSEIRRTHTLPVGPPGGAVAAWLQWTFATNEAPGNTARDDFLSADILDAATGARLLNLLRVSVASGQGGGAGDFVPAACPGETGSAMAYEIAPVGPKTASVRIPPCLHGRTVILSIVVGNGGVAGGDSVAHVDSLVIAAVSGAGPPVAAHRLTVVQHAGEGSLCIEVDGAAAGAQIWTLISLTAGLPTGSGPLLGLHAGAGSGDPLGQILLPLGTAPFHVSAGPLGRHVFSVTGLDAGLPALDADFVSAALSGGAATFTDVVTARLDLDL